MLRHRETRLAIGGYLGHMWELYAMWTWLPAFLAASLAAPRPRVTRRRAARRPARVRRAGGRRAGLRVGRLEPRRARATPSVVTSGDGDLGRLRARRSDCCFGASPALLVPVAWVWGFFVVADSAQFSAMVTEAAPPHAVGTALTLQTSMGFLLTMATIQLVPVIVDGASAGAGRSRCWRSVRPAGIAAIARLRDGPQS